REPLRRSEATRLDARKPAGWRALCTTYSPGGEPMSWLRAAARRAAVRALVASAVADHQRAALVARRSIGLLDPRAILHLDRNRGLHARLHLDRDEVLREHRNLRQVELGRARRGVTLAETRAFGREADVQPAEQVIHDRRRDRDFLVAGEARRLEPRALELLDQDRERHAVLQRERDRGGERIHQAGDHRALFRHADEDLARRAILVEADGDVALV